jgi:hypothetical protein
MRKEKKPKLGKVPKRLLGPEASEQQPNTSAAPARPGTTFTTLSWEQLCNVQYALSRCSCRTAQLIMCPALCSGCSSMLAKLAQALARLTGHQCIG